MDVSPAVVVLGAASMWLMTSLDADRAHAQPGASPDDLVARPLVLEPGTVDARLTMAINVQPRLISEPTALSPDAWWGVLPRLTVGLIHSDASLDQIATSGSFCIKTSTSTCAQRYKGSGIDVRYSALEGQFALAPRLRAVIRDTDPFKPAVTLGALLRWTRGRFALTGDPYLRVPLANAPLGNRFAINLPVWFAVQPKAGWMIAVRRLAQHHNAGKSRTYGRTRCNQTRKTVAGAYSFATRLYTAMGNTSRWRVTFRTRDGMRY